MIYFIYILDKTKSVNRPLDNIVKYRNHAGIANVRNQTHALHSDRTQR